MGEQAERESVSGCCVLVVIPNRNYHWHFRMSRFSSLLSEARAWLRFVVFDVIGQRESARASRAGLRSSGIQAALLVQILVVL